IQICGFFLRRAVATGSSPVVLVGQGDGAPLDGYFDTDPMPQVRESAVLCALFGYDAPATELAGLRYVAVPGGDPLRRQSFLVVLTESMAFAMVGTRSVPSDPVLEVVHTQDEESVYLLAEHVIRRIPFVDGDPIRPLVRELVRPAEGGAGAGPHEAAGGAAAGRTRSRWGLRRD
ncbi:hypothetical protein, partial [Actinotalea sp.]|uniref:hypothetical protein n=1 Tax=Actinotalea sp. TaxID=1872145 RepID=UPI003561BA14